MTIGSAHHLRLTAGTLAKRRAKHVAQPPGRFAAGTYEELAAAREGGLTQTLTLTLTLTRSLSLSLTLTLTY